jgi:hypothetical protein
LIHHQEKTKWIINTRWQINNKWLIEIIVMKI